MSWRAALTDRTFIVHYVQMLVAMVAGTLLLGPLMGHAGHHSGGAEAGTLLMATTMVAGVAAWAVVRGDGVAETVEMAIAMYAAFVVLFPLLWLDVLSPTGLTVLGHVLMLPAMALVMLRHHTRKPEESHVRHDRNAAHHTPPPAGRLGPAGRARRRARRAPAHHPAGRRRGTAPPG